jgi:hypothetical protein
MPGTLKSSWKITDSSLFKRRSRTLKRNSKRLSLEQLEHRRLLAATVIDTTFTNIPANVSLIGSPLPYRVNNSSGGQLVLTQSAASQTGSLIVASTGSRAQSFDAMVRMLVGGDQSGGEGYSVGYGDLSGRPFGEQGETNRDGLWFSVDTFVGSTLNGEISVYYNKNRIASHAFIGNARMLLAPAEPTSFNFSVTESGLLSYSLSTVSGFAPIQIQNWAPQPNWRWGVGARTGAFFDMHAVDALRIRDTTPNYSPTSLNLSGLSVPENLANATVGNLSTTDGNELDQFTYSLVPGPGSTDNTSFQIVGNQLRTATGLDFEAGATRSVRIRTTDQGGLWLERAFTIHVTDVNEAPVSLDISSTSVLENQPVGTVVANLGATDPDHGSTMRYALVSGPGADDNSNFQVVGNQLLTATTFDRETKSSYTIRLRVSDQHDLAFERTAIITIANVDEAPTNILLSSLIANAGEAAGSTVGYLSTVDPEQGAMSYSLVSGPGSNENSYFTIVGDQLRTTTDFINSSLATYRIRIQTQDPQGLVFQKAFVIERVENRAITFVQTLSNSTFSQGGTAVDLDPQVLAIGSPAASSGGFDTNGRVMVFSSTLGTSLYTIQSPTPRDFARFGSSLSVADGYLAVGSPRDTISGKFGAGSAHVFNSSNGTLVSTLNNPAPSDDDWFGESLSTANGLVAVGAPHEAGTGRVYIFQAATGALLRTLTHPNPLIGTQNLFGTHVHLADGKVFVAAWQSSGQPDSSGSVYIFDAASGALLRTINNPAPAAFDYFGTAMDAVGDRLLVGTPRDDAAGLDSGSAYLFDLNTGNLLRTLVNPFAASTDLFGSSVAISGTKLLVGIPQNDSFASNAGIVMAFDASTGQPGQARTLRSLG